MLVKDIMHTEPVCCTPETTIKEVSQMMVDCDCGAIPVVGSLENMKLVGIITDRDIVCRAVAKGKDPNQARVGECLSSPTVTVTPESTLEKCLEIMEENQVRRIPVVNMSGDCCGVITQSQVVRHASDQQVARLLKDISKKISAASAIGASR